MKHKLVTNNQQKKNNHLSFCATKFIRKAATDSIMLVAAFYAIENVTYH